jgi:hypothetical protein
LLLLNKFPLPSPPGYCIYLSGLPRHTAFFSKKDALNSKHSKNL